MQNTGVNSNQSLYYQQSQNGGVIMGYPPPTSDQQRQQQIMSMQGAVPGTQIYSNATMQAVSGRSYSTGTSQESSPGIQPPSQSQPGFPATATSQSNEQQQQYQNRPLYQQSQMQHSSQQQNALRTMEQSEQSKKEETKSSRPMNPPPYSPEILNSLSKYSVASLACIGRELVQELLLRTYTLMTSLTKSVDRWHQQQGISDPEYLLSYCEYILSKINEVRLRIDRVPKVRDISEDGFIALMTDPSPFQKSTRLMAKMETFEVQRQKLVKLNMALKNLDWMCLVSDPRFLKKADRS